MWSTASVLPTSSLGRKLLTAAVGLIMACLAVLFVHASDAHAADATWDQGSIVYQSKMFTPQLDARTGDGLGLAPGSKVFTHAPSSSGTQTIQALVFAPNTDLTKEATAQLYSYRFVPPGTYSDRQGPLASIAVAANPGLKPSTSCSIGDGIGWLACPISRFISKMIDHVYDAVASFLMVRELETTERGGMYIAWSIMRDFANIAFIIAFLVIIYSHLTSVGISNYHLKTMLPRLLVAAILVNVSYWVCAVAIDLSNIAGVAVNDIFNNIADRLAKEAGAGRMDLVNAKSITEGILTGTAIAGAGAAGAFAIASTAGGAVYMLIPILLSIAIAILVALLVLAARQAVITLLVIISPLAFVAFILPGTEKLFDKWRKIFVTLLLAFPMIAAVFGGSQLAALLMIQNANSINVVLFALAVQMIPLVLTPLLVKFAGSLGTRLAGIVNNPQKGIMDRTKRWAEGRRDARTNKAIANAAEGRAGFAGLNKSARYLHNRRKNRDDLRKGYEAAAEAQRTSTSGYMDAQLLQKGAALDKSVGDSTVERAHATRINSAARFQQADLAKRLNESGTAEANKRAEANWREYEAGHSNNVINPAGLSSSALANFVQDRNARMAEAGALAQSTTLEEQRAKSAHNFHERHVADTIEASTNLQNYAGGIDGQRGATRVKAAMVSAQNAAKAETTKNIYDAANIAPGNFAQAQQEFIQAVNTGNAEAARAFSRILSDQSSKGLQALYEAVEQTEGTMPANVREVLRFEFMSNGKITGGAEDIATWARDHSGRSISEISQSASTWGISADEFANLKSSTQKRALLADGGNAWSPQKAKDILSSDTLRAKIKDEKITEALAKRSRGEAIAPTDL